MGHDTSRTAPRDMARHAQATEVAECERGDLNPFGTPISG